MPGPGHIRIGPPTSACARSGTRGHYWELADVRIEKSGIGPARRTPANPARSGRKQR